MSAVLSPKTIEIVKATVPVIDEYGTLITQTMYKRLFKNEEIAALFNQANQKSGTQHQALAGAILAYARNIDTLGALGQDVERMAQKHIGYAILPEHYPYVADALLGAIKEVLGDAATPEVLNAWGEAYWFLADILKGREANIREEIMAQDGGWTDWRPFVIAERRKESASITSFILRPQDGKRVVPQKPGQYLTLRFDSAGLAGVKRNYSISSAPNADYYRITVKREENGEGSVFLHDNALEGTVIECTPPAGEFYLPDEPQRPILLLSGGVGLTPMVSMMEVIAQKHVNIETWYVHGTTNRKTHAMNDHVLNIAQKHGKTSVATFYEQIEDNSEANAGLITIDWLQENTPLHDVDVYLCGPRPFLRNFVPALLEAGLPRERIHYEFFGPSDEIIAA